MTPSYILGLIFIFLVSVVWSLASVLVQYLYTDQHFDSPFLLTYIGTSLFIVLLPTRFLYEYKRRIFNNFGCFCFKSEPDELLFEQNDEIIPWRTTDESYQDIPSSTSASSSEDDHLDDDAVAEGATTNHVPNTFQGGGVHQYDEQHQLHHQYEVKSDRVRLWSHEQHFRVALRIAPVWFFANWSYNASLAFTSITSSTVLASTGSLFTFLFAVTMRDESFTTYKLLGVLLGVTGSILTGLHDVSTTTTSQQQTNNDTHIINDRFLEDALMPTAVPGDYVVNSEDFSNDSNNDTTAVWGDALGLLSAMGYGAYTVMIRVYCPRDERRFSMQYLLGYIGLVNAVGTLPILLLISIHSAEHVTLTVFGFLVMKGLLDNVLSDYLWARAVVLTSATVATVGLGLTIPLAFVSDWILGHGKDLFHPASIFGAVAVLVGFVLVNLEEATTTTTTTNDADDDGEEQEISGSMVETTGTTTVRPSINPQGSDPLEDTTSSS